MCLFCFEGRGGEKGGSANFKAKHTEPFIPEYFLPVSSENQIVFLQDSADSVKFVNWRNLLPTQLTPAGLLQGTWQDPGMRPGDSLSAADLTSMTTAESPPRPSRTSKYETVPFIPTPRPR